jgi:hypothetical protein
MGSVGVTAHPGEVARRSAARRILVPFLAAALGGASAAGAPACTRARSTGPDEAGGWFAFDPAPDAFAAGSGIDLRFLNERFAGENGFVGVRDGQFIHAGNGQPLRFWAVNLPLNDFKDPRHQLGDGELRTCARLLAKHGVNMVRIHVGYFDDAGQVDLARVRQAIRIVEAMKAEGIYTHFSTYYPPWLRPRPGTPWLEGYDGRRHPFAALFFNRPFQARYRAWWTALLTTPSPTTGRPLVDEPAVASLEMLNEDSLFFWTFSSDQVPDAQLRILEKGFGEWLVKRFGSLEAAFARWKGARTSRDAPAEGRVGFRPLWNVVVERTPRDQDTARFLLETQTRFYAETHAFLRALGFRGPIAASNWITASAEVLGPLEKLSYTAGDFIDRHGYFGCDHQGPAADWSVRGGHTYSDRSALRFDGEGPGKPRRFWNPVMDPHYGGKPSMISETTWERPNRFRSEAPLYYAAYGALQHSDAIVHFALDGCRWSAKPNRVMQPWTLMTPAMMGQFPAAALIFRRGLVGTGEVLAGIDLDEGDLVRLEGTPLPQDAAPDDPGLAGAAPAGTARRARRLDPLLLLAGRAEVTFTTSPTSVRSRDLRNLVDRAKGIVVSSTGELKLDYARGVLTIDAARAQGVSGLLKAAGTVETKDLAITSDLELGHIVAVATDDLPLARSGRILLQVMSEERPSGYRTEPAPGGAKRIDDVGRDPWLVRELTGTVRFKRADAAALRVTALDFNGYPAGDAGTADHVTLRPNTVYYSIGP